jgi:hypothetical protein
MKNIVKLMVLSLVLVTPSFSQTVTKPAPAPGSPVTLSEVDELTFENTILKTQLANTNAKAAADSFTEQRNNAQKLISTFEVKYKAVFDQNTGKFVTKAAPVVFETKPTPKK